MNEKISALIGELRNYQKTQLSLGKVMLEAYDGAFYPLDFLAIAVLNRSQALIVGFCSLLESKNFICAAPLIRLQVDNCLRFYAAFLVNKPHDFALNVLKGIPIRKMKDRDNKLMTDRYLAEKMSEKDPWMLKLYEETSGYIHLSEKHIYNTITGVSDDRKMSFKISADDVDITDDEYVDAIKAFKAATGVLLKYVHGWTVTKANPEKVAELREKLKKEKGTK